MQTTLSMTPIDWPLALVIISIIGAVAKLWHDWVITNRETKTDKPVTDNRIEAIDAWLARTERHTDERFNRIDDRIGRMERQIDDVLDTLVEMSK